MNKWLYLTNHKDIGIFYFMFAMWASMIESLMSMIIWFTFGSCGAIVNNDQHYNFIVTEHACNMIFFMGVPVMLSGYCNFLVLLTIGSADMAYLRMNNMGFRLPLPFIMLFTLKSFISSRCWNWLNSMRSSLLKYKSLQSFVSSFNNISLHSAKFL